MTSGSRYSSLINRKIKQSGESVILLTDGNEPPAEQAVKNELQVVWNKRSPLSARNAVLSALNSCNSIDEAVLTYQPGGSNKTFHETSSAVYDLQVDRWIKGFGYLLKELIQLFLKQQHGQISFILDKNGMKVMTPLESAIFSYLKNLIQNLSVLYQNEPFNILCFESDTSRKDDFLDFFIKTSAETKHTPGKIYRFVDKKGLFDFTRN